MKYPFYAKELHSLLEFDQYTWKNFWKEYYDKRNTKEFNIALAAVRIKLSSHSKRMLTILNEVELPTISNIGKKAAQAMSVIALHDTFKVLDKVLVSFEKSYQLSKEDTYFQAIPSMIDRFRILQRQPQIFGTQWEIDDNNWPFLPTVKDYETLNKRREEYGIGPLRWPRSLAMPKSEQPWLHRPLSELVMKDISDTKYDASYKQFLK